MEHLSQYIEADYAVLSAVLYCLGRVLKALGRFPNRLIPLTLTGCGIALAVTNVFGGFDITHKMLKMIAGKKR